LGLSAEKIASKPALLGQNPETLRDNGLLLRGLGLSPAKIASQPQLLSMNPETVRRNAEILENLGFTRAQMALQPQLLGKCPKSIIGNYMNLRRFFPKEAILKHPALLGNSKETIESSVQFLVYAGIDYASKPALCGTTASKKRMKIAALLKEAGYSGLGSAGRRELAEKALRFVRGRPHILKSDVRKAAVRFARSG
jgi:hypothetical protein